MKHLLNCIERVQYDHVHDEMLLHNLKRKIEEDPTEVVEDVKRQYNVHYSPTKVRSLSVRNDASGICLYDDECQQARFFYPRDEGLRPMLIPPIGSKNIVPYNYTKLQLGRLIPKMPKDALVCIFGHLAGWDLLPLRLVCRQWNMVLKGTHSLWKIHIARAPDKWIGLSPFHTYLKHLFLNVPSLPKLYDFFLRNPMFFKYICGLLMGHFELGPMLATRTELSIGGYRLNQTSGLTYGGRWMNIEVFLDAYRQSVI